MVPSDFSAIPGLLSLSQTPATTAPSGPAVPGASGNGPALQGTPSAPVGPAGNSAPAGNPMNGLIWMLPVLLLVMIVLPSLGNKKQKKQRDAMMAGLKRGDQVLTSAGILGSIVEIADHDVLLRVDEASNTRIRFAKSAIQQVLKEGKDSPRADFELKPKTEAANAR